MWHVAVIIICINFSFGIVGALDIFHIVPEGETATYASWSPVSAETIIAFVTGGVITFGVARLFGLNIPLGAVAYATVFGFSALPLSATLGNFAKIDGWPPYLNLAIFGIVGFVFIWGFIQLASVGGKVVE